MNFKCKIWLYNNGKAFGEGPYDILKRINRLKSLNKAAAEIHMSYSQAWNLINTMEKRLNIKLIRRKTGGNSGGGSYLTPEAKDLMLKYGNFIGEADEILNNLFNKHFG
ncbi:molybdate transport system regulatory protein [Desulfotomaculum arcticum]|uniref:Molybdate transport system regulatory protein n=1 Tax=Desulfotruncus arcticus DSM 17038 TaxID=1121424 RepID=A0A1I2S2Y5_9FIRM|nr:LysR family transcriptional regulator [Desulfotruncus arcticus]SFG47295.1 molybdate transport system regulatory protein [Desulfotomaculum arcticum] [Desulfotruncus arcticus DSM 17038]